VDSVQLPLRFAVEQNYFPDDFLKSESNALALAAIEAWPNWPSYGLVIFGAAKVGKTHLAHIFEYKSKAVFLMKEKLESLEQFDPLIREGAAYILEDVCPWLQTYEHSLFHLCNLIKERGASLLITAELSPSLWQVSLADLKSRLSLFPAVRVDQPDDELLEAILIKKVSEMQIDLDLAVRRYILTHTERSASFLVEFLERLDARSLAFQRKITIPLVREVLGK
jgi:DnaA regulatory inactivator Hda